MSDLQKLIKELNKLAAPGRLTAGVVRSLADRLEEDAKAMQLDIARKYADDKGVIVELGPFEIEWGFGLTEYLIGARAPFDEQYNRILTELNEARFRAKEYKLAVEKLDDDAKIPDDVLPFVAPLVFVVRGSQQPRVLLGAPFINTPDLTTPITAANQYSAFSELVAGRYESLFAYVNDEVKKRIDQAITFGPYVLLGAVAIGAAILFKR